MNTVETTDDIQRSIYAKDVLNELANDVNIVYSSDVGTKKSRLMNLSDRMRIYYKNKNNRKYLSTTLKLSDNSSKEITADVNCRVSFSNNPNYYYKDVGKDWLYNVEVKWINDSNGNKSVNIDFKNYYT